MQVWTNKNMNGPIDSYDYDIKTEDNRVVLNYSTDEQWAEPGGKAGVLIDDGSGVVIKLKDHKPISLDYHEVVEVLSLLIANYNDKMEFRETKTIKSI